ncbi:MAG TPA: hypothetical protein VIO64_22905 [Pseudobacteroides sp.]|uniref:hypothetical protein n=1 Tax=Pseudobacteroides sp. TaxID=1968840 RepID=UPI002F93C01B
MPSVRYNFPIKSKVRVGRLIQYPFVSCYLADDTAAQAFATWLESKLANEAQVGITRVVLEGQEGEIQTPANITDTEDKQMILHMTGNPKKKVFLTIPGCKCGADLSSISTLGVTDDAGNAMTKVLDQKVLGKNVIAGGPY